MVQKRQLAEEEYDVSPKHLKLENSCHLVSSLEFPSKDAPLKPYASGKTEGHHSESSKILDLPVGPEKDVGYAFLGRLSTEDTYSYLLRCPPLKLVPIGPAYQADIPKWRPNGPKTPSTLGETTLAPNPISYLESELKFMGSCVLPMPESDRTIGHDDAVRTNCRCENPASRECVEQHIREARKDLKKNIGTERFLELGFDNMGDFVANRWTEEEEQLLHEVVYSNPASLGQNFWDHLAAGFPSRTNREIVSYYFNVFVLQKRAEQNRRDPINADSDDDEWQWNDSSDEDEIREYDFGVENPVFDYCKDTGFLRGFSGFANLGSSPPCDKTPVDESGGDRDFQDDSCTSSDEVKNEFIFEHSDSKVWDVGFFSFPRNKTDFLPTGSMIEEVFGVDFLPTGSKGSS